MRITYGLFDSDGYQLRPDTTATPHVGYGYVFDEDINFSDLRMYLPVFNKPDDLDNEFDKQIREKLAKRKYLALDDVRPMLKGVMFMGVTRHGRDIYFDAERGGKFCFGRFRAEHSPYGDPPRGFTTPEPLEPFGKLQIADISGDFADVFPFIQ